MAFTTDLREYGFKGLGTNLREYGFRGVNLREYGFRGLSQGVLPGEPVPGRKIPIIKKRGPVMRRRRPRGYFQAIRGRNFPLPSIPVVIH